MGYPPSRWWHLLSVVLLVIGPLAVAVPTALSVVKQFESAEEFSVPGTHALKLEEPGEYVVWNTVSTFRHGRQYNFPEKLPGGTHIRVIDDASGREIPTESCMSTLESVGTEEHASVCSFRIAKPGGYSVTVDGTSEERILRVRQAIFPGILWKIALCLIAGLLAFSLAVLISVVVEVRQNRWKKAQANQPQTLMPPANHVGR